jgi:HTH-type transcriptional regulator / antitoxin HigA
MGKRSGRVVGRGKEDKYLKLVRAFPLRPIRSESELDHAIEVTDSLLDRDDLDDGEEDYLDVLGDLVYKYEADHDPIQEVSDADMLRFLLDSKGISQTELAQQSGIAESTISEILRGKRALSRRHIAALSCVFHVSPAVFFHEAALMTPDRLAKTISRRSGMHLTYEMLVSLASAFACEADRASWRAFQEMVAGERPGMPADVMAKRLNSWEQQFRGSSCWWPAAFELTCMDVQALVGAFSHEADCWNAFREMVEEAIPEVKGFQREIAEEN